MSTENKISVEDAERALRADYFGDIRSMAQEAISMIRKGEIADREALDRWIEQSVDGNQRVIYTHKARVLMTLTDNPDAYEEAAGDLDRTGLTVEAQAFYAMLADLHEQLESEAAYATNEAERFDINDEDSWPTPENVKKAKETEA